MLEKAKSLQSMVIFPVFLNRGEKQANQKFAAVKEWSSNYVHARFWSECIKLKAIFGSFLSNSVVYQASEVCTLAYI